MRERLACLVSLLLTTARPADRFETDFDSVAQMVDAARAFRSHGCTVRVGGSPLRLVVTVPHVRRTLSIRLPDKTHG